MSIPSFCRPQLPTKKSSNLSSGISRVTSLADAIHSTAQPLRGFAGSLNRDTKTILKFESVLAADSLR